MVVSYWIEINIELPVTLSLLFNVTVFYANSIYMQINHWLIN